MEIVNVRIDERLIHGQVAAVSTNTLRNATRIMVIDDMAAKDENSENRPEDGLPVNG